MEELKCLTCNSTDGDEECRGTGELQGCDEDVSTLSDIEGPTGRDKWDFAIHYSQSQKWDFVIHYSQSKKWDTLLPF